MTPGRTSLCATVVVVLWAGAVVGAGEQERSALPERPMRTANEATPPVLLEEATPPLRALDLAGLEDRWGITLQGLRLTAAGYMLDLRYHVLDAAKAAPLFVRRTRPILLDEKTGTRFAVLTPPKVGAMRSSNDPKEGKTYFMFFANPGRRLQKGQRVTVTIGDFSVKGLVVR